MAVMKSLTTHIGGYPRIGAQRELKWALEKYWSSKITRDELEQTASELRQRHWQEQQGAGLSFVTTNDFSFYDQVLDTACVFGIVPERFGLSNTAVSLDDYFSLARGNKDHAALALTKWFNTNYHYLVPEISEKIDFTLNPDHILIPIREAIELGHNPKPVLIGPVTLLSLSRPARGSQINPLSRLPELLPHYAKLLQEIKAEGVEWIQIDEPILSCDLSPEQHKALASAYDYLSNTGTRPNILLASYYGKIANNLNRTLTLPVEGFHIDAVSAPEDICTAARYLPEGKVLSIGIVDAQNIWINDLNQSRATIEQVASRVPKELIWIGTSCSLQHVPHQLDSENHLDANILNWLAFAKEKLNEVSLLSRLFNDDHEESRFAHNATLIESRKTAAGSYVDSVRQRVSTELPKITLKRTAFETRQKSQREQLKLPLLPTTTIGSFPQTSEIRQARAKFRKGGLSHAQYQSFLQQKTKECIEHQEKLGLDVLVHGEFERNDMVEYFAEGLEGFAVTEFGWVQSYGSRCTKPPIIWGDVHRPKAITLDWIRYAQSLTNKPVKGMLTGTTTILQWSFIRTDIPRIEVSQQIALALRDEVLDLEASGTKIIQLDEAALREGLPLRKDEQAAYLEESCHSFLISTSGVEDSTQIHTHMCYSQFDAIFDTIIDLDADVISIETTRNRMALLDVFQQKNYPNEIGPGVWDIHSPRVPSVEEISDLIQRALQHIPAERLWINPDCGLKTRAWPETIASLKHLVQATLSARANLSEKFVSH
ncbi:methionine synthase (B12-independent) [Rubritalea squalenifaciens DSM 18772]|uniref:5-methyltetrahydropteroyltriglutamate--homocysteine methyltransferase n=2 Tax=Rubritalea squalenifaciens TaxID=407226 RepID=A0A1M6IUP4_9BACT|nr:methionine synthase (B12-independent) [Rubritalea squalenifaciens DSM 18772]